MESEWWCELPIDNAVGRHEAAATAAVWFARFGFVFFSTSSIANMINILDRMPTSLENF